MFHTPTSKARAGGRTSSLDEHAGPAAAPAGGGVRKSIGEWEAGRRKSASPSNTAFMVSPPRRQAAAAGAGDSPVLVNDTSPEKTATVAEKKKPRLVLGSKTTTSLAAGAGAGAAGSPPTGSKYADRVTEARNCLIGIKTSLGRSGNIKKEIKSDVQAAAERLYQLVKETATVKSRDCGRRQEPETEKDISIRNQSGLNEGLILQKIEESAKLIRESNSKIEKLTKFVEEQRHSEQNNIKEEMGKLANMIRERGSYASVAAGSPGQRPQNNPAIHSIIIASKDDQETGDQVFEKIKKVINAKEEGLKIDRIRKAKDRKIIVGCRDREEIRKVRERLTEKDGQLSVEEIENKDPLVIMYGILKTNTNEDVLQALRVQNKSMFRDLKEEDNRVEIRYRKRARNPLTEHVVAKVSPHIWRRLTDAGAVHIDMQRVKVADQSPLVQCSRCLGYGHGKRFCTEAVDVCSHCGGAHHRADCAEWLANTPPSCINCVKGKLPRADHNAFSSECSVRRKWEAQARSTVAYC